MIPTVVIVGRPNVGKSTLFNRLTRSRDAIVHDIPGLTRDRHYGRGKVGYKSYIVVDTGGLEPVSHEGVMQVMAQQTLLAIDEADAVVMLVDGRQGLTTQDRAIADQLRKTGRKIWLVVNKAEGMQPATVSAEFHELALGDPLAISAAHGDGVSDLADVVTAEFPDLEEVDEDAEPDKRPRIAIVGRPNVGKSTLVNSLLGEERVVVFDQPGTTRDSIYIDFERTGQRYTLIDTAGVRRRANVTDAVEKFSVIKTLQAIEDANVVVLVLDARDQIVDQDAHIAGYIVEAGRALVVAVNKWDGLRSEQRESAKTSLERTLNFIDYAPVHYISALEGHRHQGLARRGRARLPRRHDQTAHAQADACAGIRDRPPGAATGWDFPAQDALCPPGRQQSAPDHHSRHGTQPRIRQLSPLPGTFLPRCF